MLGSDLSNSELWKKISELLVKDYKRRNSKRTCRSKQETYRNKYVLKINNYSLTFKKMYVSFQYQKMYT